ncbi:MAG TPA: dihydrofolate reductase family protein [Streptosporangiaceae bacterium]|jgi:dihydrofolate reductase
MAKLIYFAITSLDGYIADADGRYDWAAPDDEVFRFVSDFERPIGTYLYGRRLYQEMIFWETAHTQPGQSDLMLDFARNWQAADKVVYSRTLDAAATARTRIERTFDPAAVRQLKARADRDITVGYANLAGQAIKAGLVDECHLLISPVMVGGGTRALPDGARVHLELLGQRRFGNGAVHLHYRTREANVDKDRLAVGSE